MTVNVKIVKLNKVMDLLNQADCVLQEALGAGDECYEIHNAIENVMDDVCDVIRTLDETVV